MKKFINVLIFVMLFLLLSAICVFADGISVIIDGVRVDYSVEPLMYNSRINVPLRETFEALGADVSWNESTYTATAVKDGITVSVKNGSDELFVNNRMVKMDTPVIEREDRILISVRYAAEAFGYNVTWNETVAEVNISSDPGYECYDIEGEKVPVYTAVVGNAQYIEEKLDISTDSDYAYATTYEDVTEYIMVLQKLYGYSYYTTQFGENGSILHVYRNTDNNGTVRILCANDDKYGYVAVITPTSKQPTAVESEPDRATENGRTAPESEIPAPEENDDVEYYENTNNTLPTYTYITGCEPYAVDEKEDCIVYKYKDSFASAAQYEMALSMFCGYTEYNTDIDFGTVTSYYTNGEIVVGIVNSMFNNEVWIIIAN